MKRSLFALASISLCGVLACGAASPGGDDGAGVERAGEQGFASGALTTVSQPADAGNGLAVKSVCKGNTGNGGDCTIPSSSLNTVARAVAALNAPTPSATPDTIAQVISFVPGGTVNWSDFQGGAVGIYSGDADLRGWFGTEVFQVPYSFAGYLAIPASASATTKSFAVGSDDGFAMAVSNGTQVFKYTYDGPRSFDTSGTASATSGTQPPNVPVLQVTFPASDAGVLYPIDLVFYEQEGQEGVELSWADGAKTVSPTASALNGFSLIPQASFYAPDIRASLWAQNTDAAAGPVGAGTHLTYTTQISNPGTVAASGLSFTVVLPAALSAQGTPTNCAPGFVTTAGVTKLSCTSIGIAAGAAQTITFKALVTSAVGGSDAGTTVLDVQGVVSGLATSTDVTTVLGDTAEIYVFTDDPGAGAPLNAEDTGNAPESINGPSGLVDDDATRFTVGQALAQPPVITAPASAVSSLSRFVVSGTSGFIAGQQVLVTITGPQTKTCTATVVSGGTWACASLALPDGSYSAVASVVNAAGQTGQPSAAFSITVNAPPVPVLTTPASGAVVRQSQVFLAGTANVPAGTSVVVTVTDSTNSAHVCTANVQADESWVCAETLADGGYSWTAAVPELFPGAIGPSAAVQMFTVNTAGLPAPTLAQTASPTAQPLPLLSGTANGSDAGVGYKLVVYDGNTPICTVDSVPASWSCTPSSALADGTHILTAVIFDGAGNSSPASNPDVFVLDTHAPAAPTLVQLATPTNQTQPVLSGTGEPGAALAVVDSNGDPICTTVVQSNGDWSCSPSTPLASTTFTVTAKQTDEAGNTSAASSPMTFTIDTTAPGKPTLAQPTSPTNDNTPTLSGTAEEGTSVVVTDQNGTVICSAVVVPSSGNWSCTSGTLPDGSDVLTATSTDGAGNSSSSSPVTVVVDTVAPAAPVLAQNASPTANTLPSFSGTAESGTTVTVFVNGVAVCAATTVSGAFSCTSTIVLSGAPTSYTALATARDAALNTSPVSNTDTFVIDTTVPVAPTLAPLPTPPGGQPGTTTDTQPTFHGTGTPGDLVSVEVLASGPASAQARSPDAQQAADPILCSGIVVADGTWQCTTQADEAISGDPATTVTVDAFQETPAGVISPRSASMTFTVISVEPGTPTLAALPANIATATPPLSGTGDAGTTITVRDESGRAICSAEVQSDGTWSCAPEVPLHEGENTLTATAVGPSGLASAPSNSVSTNVDTLAPQPPILSQTPSPTANTLPTFTGTAEPGSTVNIYDGSDATPVATCTAASDGSFSCPATLPLTGAPSTHSVQATATDAAGNVSGLSNVDQFVVDTAPPPPPVLNALPTPPGATPGFSYVTQPTFTGTGTPGETVTVQSTSPSTQPLCTAIVKSDGTWTCTSTVTLNGDPATGYTFVATQASPAGVPSAPSNPIQQTISTAQPSAPTLVVPANPSSSQTVPLSGTGTPGDTVVALDPTGQILCSAIVQPNGSWSCTTSALPEGATIVTAVDVSTSGVPSQPSQPGTVTVITFGPLAPTLAQTASPTNDATPAFHGKAQPGSTVTVSENGQTLCNAVADLDGNFSCQSAVALTNGVHNVTASAVDAAGNQSAASNVDQFIVDATTPPAPVIAQHPAENGGQPGVTSNPDPVIAGTGVPGDTVTVTSGGQTLCTALVNPDGTWSCASTVSLPGDPATTYPLSATQTSPAGNTSPPGTGTITVDTTATAAPTLDQPVTPTRDRQPAFTGTGVPGDTVQVFTAATLLCSATVSSAGAWTCAPTAPLADGSYNLIAVQLGPQGAPSGSSTMRNLVVDDASLAAPTFDQPASPTEQNEPALSGTAEAGATVAVTDAMTGAVICVDASNNAGVWSCKPLSPLSLGSHTFVATATDAAGNTSPASQPRTVVVTSPDGMPHVAITSPANAAQLVNARPQIIGTSTPGTSVAVSIDGAVFQAQTSADGSWLLTPTSDLAQGMHTVIALATDGAGQVSAPATTTFQVYETLMARGGCASGGVPAPVLALMGLLVLLRLRRRASPELQPRTAEAVSAARSSLRRSLTAAGAAAIVGIATISSEARAQADFDVETFHPAAAGDGYAGVEGARPPIDEDSEGKIDLKLWLGATNKPLVALEPDGNTHALVRQRYGGWLAAQFHLNGPLSLSAQVPFLLGQNGDLSFLPPAARGPSSFAASIGDVRLTPRVSIFRQENVGIDFAAQGSLELPTGATNSLSSDGRVDGELLVSGARRFYLAGPDFIEVLGNVYTRLRPPREILDVKVGSTAGLRAAVGYYFGSQVNYVPHRVFGELDGQSYLRAGFTSGSAPAEWRVGGTWCFGHGFAADAAVGTGIGNGVGAPSARALLSIGYSPASCRLADRDGDGIPDRDDKCVDVAGVPERQGCPLPPDRDHDGVPDAEDACPDEPGLKENRGCPASHDRDGDGVPDMIDRCPEVPGPASNQGCPVEQKPPVCAPQENTCEPKAELALPLAPLMEAAPPPPPDRDHDGVPDAEDNCPDEPGPASNHGCPEAVKQLVVIHGAKIDILEKVYFATGKSVIEARSFKLLDQVAQVLNAHPELLKIEVQGHTDNVGDAKKNQKLSQARAEAVVAYLEKKSVAANRLGAKGFGSAQPVVPNVSKAAREKNRRVEFHVLDVASRSIEAVKSAPSEPANRDVPVDPK